MKKKKYRIVTDTYGGYEVQVKNGRKWEQLNFVNTHHSIEEAEEFIFEYRKERDFKSKTVKEIEL